MNNTRTLSLTLVLVFGSIVGLTSCSDTRGKSDTPPEKPFDSKAFREEFGKIHAPRLHNMLVQGMGKAKPLRVDGQWCRVFMDLSESQVLASSMKDEAVGEIIYSAATVDIYGSRAADQLYGYAGKLILQVTPDSKTRSGWRLVNWRLEVGTIIRDSGVYRFSKTLDYSERPLEHGLWADLCRTTHDVFR